MVIKVFRKEKSFRTDKTAEQISNSISWITESFHKESNKKQLFEGRVSKEVFEILPVFDYGPRKQLRPLIEGEIIDKGTFRIVDVKFGLRQEMKLLLVIGLIFNLVMTVILGATPFLAKFPLKDIWWVIPIIAVVTILGLHKYWNVKVQRSINILRRCIK